jgi:hypothetical protein
VNLRVFGLVVGLEDEFRADVLQQGSEGCFRQTAYARSDCQAHRSGVFQKVKAHGLLLYRAFGEIARVPVAVLGRHSAIRILGVRCDEQEDPREGLGVVSVQMGERLAALFLEEAYRHAGDGACGPVARGLAVLSSTGEIEVVEDADLQRASGPVHQVCGADVAMVEPALPELIMA